MAFRTVRRRYYIGRLLQIHDTCVDVSIPLLLSWLRDIVANVYRDCVLGTDGAARL
jgi:hypothetical protein